MSFTDEERDSLIEAARTAAGMAYVPFSGFRVGAALITEDGASHAGIVIVAFGPDGEEVDAPPCGACRQALYEFAPEMAVTYRRSGEMLTRSLAELLPDPFGIGEGAGG